MEKLEMGKLEMVKQENWKLGKGKMGRIFFKHKKYVKASTKGTQNVRVNNQYSMSDVVHKSSEAR